MFVVQARGAGVGTGMTNHWFYGLRAGWNDYFYSEFGREKRKLKEPLKEKLKCYLKN